jgi:hypothetical protein
VSNVTTVDKDVAPKAISGLRTAMDKFWHAVDEMTTNGDTLHNQGVWDGTVATEFRGKWDTLKPILTNARRSATDLNDNLVPYNNEITREVADDHK